MFCHWRSSHERHRIFRCAEPPQPTGRTGSGVSPAAVSDPAQNPGLVYQTAQHPPRQRRGDPVPAGETVHSGGTLAVIIGDTARKVPAAQVSRYLAGYALANDVSLPESSFYRPAIKAKCRDGFCPLGRSASWRMPIGWRSSPDQRRGAGSLVHRRSGALGAGADRRHQRLYYPAAGRCGADRHPHQRVEIKPGMR